MPPTLQGEFLTTGPPGKACFCFVLNAWMILSTENPLKNYTPCLDLYHLPSPHSQQVMALLERHIQISNTGGDKPLSHSQQEGWHREERKPYRGCRSGEAARPMSRQGHWHQAMTFGVCGADWQGWEQEAILAEVSGDLQVSAHGIRDSGVLQPRP